jgi:hypothetical protein
MNKIRASVLRHWQQLQRSVAGLCERRLSRQERGGGDQVSAVEPPERVLALLPQPLPERVMRVVALPAVEGLKLLPDGAQLNGGGEGKQSRRGSQRCRPASHNLLTYDLEQVIL